MNKRKAFTLVELLVVIGIIVLLIGILLPVLGAVRRKSQIAGEQSEFQAIESALDGYRQTFADYPRNIQLPTWDESLNGPPILAPRYFTLALALMGPGPAANNVTANGSGIYQIGDGADGPGFRTQAYSIPGTASASTGTITVTFLSRNPQFIARIQGYSPTDPTATITFDPGTSNSTQKEETCGIATFSTAASSATSTQITLSGSGATYTHAGNCVIRFPTGKVWPSFLAADQFHVAWVPMSDSQGTPFDQGNAAGGAATALGLGGWGMPVLLDHFGQVIQYFPRYGAATNRTVDSAFAIVDANGGATTSASVGVGPLIGDCQPKSVDANYGWNGIFDPRDGAPFFDNLNETSANVRWPSLSALNSPYSQANYSLNFALMWMLGDDSAKINFIPVQTPATALNPALPDSKLRFSGDYILISAGPDGPFRNNGGFCNFYDSTAGALVSSDRFQKLFTASGNIYNFDR